MKKDNLMWHSQSDKRKVRELKDDPDLNYE